MNDFTKEELLEIYGLLEHHYCDPVKCFNPNTKLLLKIESMIDNYCEDECEHKWIKCFYGEESIPIKLCSLCNLRERIG